MDQEIDFSVNAGIATITLNRPDRLNALTTGMTKALLTAIRTCERESAIRCVVLTGAGRAFCAGQDLAEFQRVGGDLTVGDHLRHGFNRIAMGLHHLEKPVLAKINGVAAGAGLGIALAADMRLASDQAVLTAAFIGLGLAPDTGVSWFLQQLLGPARAFEFLASGRKIDAAAARDLGLVNQVIPAAELDAKVAELANQFAVAPTRGIGLTKRVLHKVASRSLEEALAYEAQVQDIAFATADHREGLAAFLEKRPAHFTGE